MNNKKKRVGDMITISKNGHKRNGRIICMNRTHRWILVEFTGKYWNSFKKAYDKYRECFFWNPSPVQHDAMPPLRFANIISFATVKN